MAQNPLQQHFRQPKIFLRLPSLGVFCPPGTISGNVEQLPVFGMTGMDEIIMKTPDALLTGESTVKVIQSCCPSINDAWNVSNVDVESLLVAIRIATFGNTMTVETICSECQSENTYEIALSEYLDYFNNCKFETNITLTDLIVRVKPLSYKEMNQYNIENFSLQKQLSQVDVLETEEEKQALIQASFENLGKMQNSILLSSIDQVETANVVVTEKPFIKEWLDNCDRVNFETIKSQINANNRAWKLPDKKIKCSKCETENTISLELDQSNFFVNA
jgi:hypothetical protein